MAVAVRMMELAQHQSVTSITLFAGDRDFYDAVEFAINQGKQMNIIAFRDNFAPRLSQLLDNSNIAFLNDYWPTMCEVQGAGSLLPPDFD